MPLLLGFDTGAMIFLVILDLISEALATARQIAWSFVLGLCLMILVQVLL